MKEMCRCSQGEGHLWWVWLHLRRGVVRKEGHLWWVWLQLSGGGQDVGASVVGVVAIEWGVVRKEGHV